MTTWTWWCPLCFSETEARSEVSLSIMDRNAHLLCRHPEVSADSPWRTLPDPKETS